MRIVIWLAEGTWEACVDAAADLVTGLPATDSAADPATADRAELILVHVLDPGIGDVARGAQGGLLGRGRPGGGRSDAIVEAAAAAQAALLDAAAHRLGRPAARDPRRGRAEREVVAACAGAGLLIMARDGDHSRLGPRSIGPVTRFVLDHAPCRVLLVWPDDPPALATLPPPPHKPPPHKPRGPRRMH
jgi:nucleotide-binding universal stress UspA family protein